MINFKKDTIFLQIWSFVVGLTLILNNLNPYFGIAISSEFYVIYGITFMIIIIKDSYIKINFKYILLLTILLFSIIFNEIPSFFRPYDRFFSFVLVLGLVSPLVSSQLLNNFRIILFQRLNAILGIVTLISFICLITNQPFIYNRSGFSGIMVHSMLMGPIAGISFLSALHEFLTKKNTRTKLINSILLVSAFICCITAGSRGALIALVFGFICLLLLMYRSQIYKFAKILLLAFGIFLFTYPIWEDNTSHLISKMEYAEKEESLSASRDDLWKNRIREFESSPIFGIGFGSVDTSQSNKFDRSNGKVEPGSSWLAVLSMTGIFGILIVGFIFLRSSRIYLKPKYYLKDEHSEKLFGSLLIFFVIHLLVEGYIFSSGAMLFFYLWLLIAAIDIRLKYSSHLTEHIYSKSLK